MLLILNRLLAKAFLHIKGALNFEGKQIGRIFSHKAA